MSFAFIVPFNTTADVILPDAAYETIKVNGVSLIDSIIAAGQNGEYVHCELVAGKYVFNYMPTKSYILTYSTNSSLKELLENDLTRWIFEEEHPEIAGNILVKARFLEKSLRELT